MPEPLSRRTDVAVRWSFWIAAAGLAIYLLDPGLLPDPRHDLSSSGDTASVTIHWIPASLIVWMIVSSQLRKVGHAPRLAKARLSAPYPRTSDQGQLG